jgi:amino acid transporter
VLGTQAMLAPGINSGAGIGAALASMLHAGVTKLFVVLLFFTPVLAIMTAMSGSSRTLFQSGEDGRLPRTSTKCPHTRCGRISHSTWSCCSCRTTSLSLQCPTALT